MTQQELLRIDVLGSLESTVAGTTVALGGPKQRALLAALVLRQGRVVSMNHLVDVLWQDDPPPTAVTKVQGHVYSIRKAFVEAGWTGISAIGTRAPGYLLRHESIGTDLARFDALIAAAGDAGERGDRNNASELLGAALGLWRGAAFADVPAPAIRAAADRLTERYLSAAEDKAEIDLALERYRPVLDQLGALIEEHPFRDRLRELHLLALLRLDRPREAIAYYQHWSGMLRRELGVEPGRRLQRLVASIGNHQ